MSKKEKFFWVLSTLFLGIYYVIVWQNTVNIPEGDDFVFFLKFLTDFKNADLTDKIGLIISHGQHRLVPSKIITLLVYNLTGSMNFSTMIFIANLLMLVAGFILIIWLKNREMLSIFALSVVLLVFNGQNAETSAYAMLGLCNVGAILFMLLSTFLVLHDNRKCFATGVIITAITIFTNGNAFILLPVLAAALLLQKKKRRALVFVGLVSIPVAYYFATYKAVESAHSDIITLIINYFCFIGNSLWINPTLRILPCLTGVIICITWIYALRKQYYMTNMACFAFLTFMLITGVAVVLNRPDSDGMGDQRFRIYGSIHLVLTLMIWLEMFDLKRQIKYFIPLIICFSITSTLIGTERLVKITENKKASSYNWRFHKTGLTSLAYIASTETVLNAEVANIYIFPAISLQSMQSTVVKNADWENRNSDISYAVDYYEERDGFVVLRGWAYTNLSSMNFMETTLYLIANMNIIKINPYWECRFDVSSEREKKYCGFFAVISKKEIPEGTYRLGIELHKQYFIPVIPVKNSLQCIETDVEITL